MLLDINTWVGQWPFRHLNNATVTGLLKRMDKAGVDRAIVGHAAAAMYRDPHGANEDLHRQVGRHTDRLLPVATLRPAFPGWQEDLRRCHEEYGFGGLRLLPQYHEYHLTDAAALDLIDAATDRGFFLQVPQRIEDRRTRHPWDIARDLGGDEFVDALKKRPKAGWMLLNASGLQAKAVPKKARYVVDISRLTAVLQRNMQQILDDGGPDRLAFGTGMCFKVADPALLKLDVLDRGKRVRDGIASRNAQRLIDGK